MDAGDPAVVTSVEAGHPAHFSVGDDIHSESFLIEDGDVGCCIESFPEILCSKLSRVGLLADEIPPAHFCVATNDRCGKKGERRCHKCSMMLFHD